MAATSSVHPAPHINFDTFYEPPMIKWLIAPKRERVHGRDAITYLCANHPIQNPEWVDAKDARLPSYQKSAKDTSKTKKKNRKRPEYPSTINGRECGKSTLERELRALSEALWSKHLLSLHRNKCFWCSDIKFLSLNHLFYTSAIHT
ncbi:hypothetical protein D8674_000288 [Pyrus ussuriensis x Pyrus communis]|uniref:Uncharacterized protein n=1 Tax=Pyrus ussuriensis x Pyrus communis TaxID=2448454 RepID=A0A5N5F2P9_9ROSA|nr:hypothetical protein D8674_000288 [Pyrus ussuriensis x Pyrus communis]